MAKKKAKKTTAKKAASKDVLVVASKVKAYVKSKGMMSSSDAVAALNEVVYATLDAAIERTKANKRSTVKPQDL
jgi:histone H3/H4